MQGALEDRVDAALIQEMDRIESGILYALKTELSQFLSSSVYLTFLLSIFTSFGQSPQLLPCVQ